MSDVAKAVNWQFEEADLQLYLERNKILIESKSHLRCSVCDKVFEARSLQTHLEDAGHNDKHFSDEMLQYIYSHGVVKAQSSSVFLCKFCDCLCYGKDHLFKHLYSEGHDIMIAHSYTIEESKSDSLEALVTAFETFFNHYKITENTNTKNIAKISSNVDKLSRIVESLVANCFLSKLNPEMIDNDATDFPENPSNDFNKATESDPTYNANYTKDKSQEEYLMNKEETQQMQLIDSKDNLDESITYSLSTMHPNIDNIYYKQFIAGNSLINSFNKHLRCKRCNTDVYGKVGDVLVHIFGKKHRSKFTNSDVILYYSVQGITINPTNDTMFCKCCAKFLLTDKTIMEHCQSRGHKKRLVKKFEGAVLEDDSAGITGNIGFSKLNNNKKLHNEIAFSALSQHSSFPSDNSGNIFKDDVLLFHNQNLVNGCSVSNNPDLNHCGICNIKMPVGVKSFFVHINSSKHRTTMFKVASKADPWLKIYKNKGTDVTTTEKSLIKIDDSSKHTEIKPELDRQLTRSKVVNTSCTEPMDILYDKNLTCIDKESCADRPKLQNLGELLKSVGITELTNEPSSFKCYVCGINVGTVSKMLHHICERKHRATLLKQNMQTAVKVDPVSNNDFKSNYCEVCKVVAMNDVEKFNHLSCWQHQINSNKHAVLSFVTKSVLSHKDVIKTEGFYRCLKCKINCKDTFQCFEHIYDDKHE